MLCIAADAEDAVQETVGELWGKRSRVQHVQNIEGYVMQAVKYRCLSVLRWNKTLPLDELEADEALNDEDAVAAAAAALLLVTLPALFGSHENAPTLTARTEVPAVMPDTVLLQATPEQDGRQRNWSTRSNQNQNTPSNQTIQSNQNTLSNQNVPSIPIIQNYWCPLKLFEHNTNLGRVPRLELDLFCYLCFYHKTSIT